tara:strand:+ start:212 stop:736 length:525 start_codon:yes stop_codon:yes gene_type:complete
MFLIKFNNSIYEKYLIDVLKQKTLPVTFCNNSKYFSQIEFNIQPKEITLKNEQKKQRILLPFLLENLSSCLMSFLSDYLVMVQSAQYFPINNTLIFKEKKIVLGDIHNKIMTHLILNKSSGVDKFELYKKIWPLDKDYQINKLDTHLSNLKNILMNDIKFKIKFSSNKGLIRLN